MLFKYNLGQYATDEVSGYQGTINARALWDDGNQQFSLKPRVKEDGIMTKGQWIDADHFTIDSEKGVVSKFGDPEFEFNHGDKVKSRKNGFTGIVSGQCQYLNGCHHYFLTGSSWLSRLLGVKGEDAWFHEAELELVEPMFVRLKKKKKPTGGPDSPSGL